jgi:hypothetical protein
MTVPGRITGIETNREMIAAEAETIVRVNGNRGAHCGLAIDFGDGTTSSVMVTESSPFPLRLNHTYPKTGDLTVRVNGADAGAAPACLGRVEAAIHVSPAGSKIEYITLSTGCPEGWQLKGRVSPDKSFACAPIPDASAPTNLIHCIDGMRYFARSGTVGCAFPAAPAPEPPKMAMGKGKGPMLRKDGAAGPATGAAASGSGGNAKSKAAAPRGGPAAKPKVKPKEKSPTGSEAPA